MFKVLVLCSISVAYAFPFFTWNQPVWSWPQLGYNQQQQQQPQNMYQNQYQDPSQNVIPVIYVVAEQDYDGSGNSTSAEGSGISAEIVIDYIQSDDGSGTEYQTTNDNTTSIENNY
ncbi:unnamed protein product [Caenorhabditis angaria]|uniref:Uncharacterized protein n=1 Tax=Caenorhabditis angaria TaxID=860376 RepID=A0A9P1IUC6_9PELO|nr:unnamed protein product [Caenorhabditis angaria]